MTIILDEIRPRRRHSAITPNIREVSLVGTPSRRYQHLTLFEEGLMPEESGLSQGSRSWGRPSELKTG